APLPLASTMKSLEAPPETLTRSSPASAATSTNLTRVLCALGAMAHSAERSAATTSRDARDIAAHSIGPWCLGSWCLVPSPLNRGQKGLPTITYPNHRHASHSGRTCGRRRGGDDVGGGRVLVRAAGAIAARIGATDSRPLAHDH